MSDDSGRQRALKIVLPILATVAILAPLAWLWQASRVAAVYSVMDMGYPDYGGGAAPDAGGGHGGHVKGRAPFGALTVGHRSGCRSGVPRTYGSTS